MALAIGCGLSTSFPLLLALRFGHGIASAALGVVVVAVIRDLFVADAMAKRMSLIFLMFMIVPLISPAVGSGINAFTTWRSIYLLFTLIASHKLVSLPSLLESLRSAERTVREDG